MSKKTLLITGATSGIGRAASHQLACHHVRLVITGRDPARTADTVAQIRAQSGNPDVHWLLADLSELQQVCRLAQEFLERFERLDVLVNNAGTVSLRRHLTIDGLERTWAVNYFQAFLLTALLEERLITTGRQHEGARIVNVSSFFHRMARLRRDWYVERGPFIGWNTYARTKLADLYATYELAHRLKQRGIPASVLSVNAVDPGLVATGMGKRSGRLLRAVFHVVDLFAMHPEKGAAGLVHLALAPEAAGISGAYFEGVMRARSSKISHDSSIARSLWEASERVTENFLS